MPLFYIQKPAVFEYKKVKLENNREPGKLSTGQKLARFPQLWKNLFEK